MTSARNLQERLEACALKRDQRSTPKNNICSTVETMVAGIAVQVSYKRIKNINMRLRPGSETVFVSAPYGVLLSQIEDLVAEKAAWIRDRQEHLRNTPSAQAENATPQEVAEWKAVVSACAPALIEAWEPIMGVKAGKLAYRNMKSRWGSCQPSTGRICLNVRLALYPPQCLEYVVVHELCHLLEPGHDSRFQALMDRYLPDWRERRKLLRG